MRILIIDGNYPKHFEQFYLKNKISGLDYNEHYKLLIDDHFGTNGAWNEPLSTFGYEVVEVYYNNTILQDHWLREFGGNAEKFSNYRQFQTIFLQIQYYKPDILYITNPHVFDENVLNPIKKYFPFIKVFACYLGTPYTAHAISEYDICFTALNNYSNDLKKIGKVAYTLPHAFNKKVLDKLLLKTNSDVTNSAYKVCFVGGMVRSNDMHTTRLDYIEFLFNNIPIEIYSDIYSLTLWSDLKENVQKKSASVIINAMKKMGFSSTSLSRLPLIGRASRWNRHQFRLFPASLRGSIQPALYAMDMYNLFSSNRIVFNIHVDNVGEEAANMRLFEATGVGACLLTDAKANLSDFFIPNEEVVTYSSKEECVEKAKWLLASPANCKAIAEAGQKRVLKDHTYQNRAPIFSEGIQRVFNK